MSLFTIFSFDFFFFFGLSVNTTFISLLFLGAIYIIYGTDRVLFFFVIIIIIYFLFGGGEQETTRTTFLCIDSYTRFRETNLWEEQ